MIGINIDKNLLIDKLVLPKAIQIGDERFMFMFMFMFHPRENETNFLEEAKLCAKKYSVMYKKLENGLYLVEDQCNSLLRSYASR